MKSQVTFQWLEPCPNERLREAQVRLRESVFARGLDPLLFPAGPEMVKLADILLFARKHAAGSCFLWCNSDVTLAADPFTLDDGQTVRGFHRREVPSGDFCGGVDMYLIPISFWDDVLSKDLPDLWCGATHVDWWLTRAAVLAGRYTSHFGFIDHVTHAESPASKAGQNPFYRHNIRQYNKWGRRNGAGLFERKIRLPIVGESLSPITDSLRILRSVLTGAKSAPAGK